MARSTHGKGCEFYMLSICRLYWSSNQTYLICRWDNFQSTMSPPICYGELFLFFLISMFLAPSKERMKGDVLTLVLSKHTITWFIIWKDEVCSQWTHSMLEKLQKIRQCKSKTTPRPIVARIRPRKKTRPKKPRPKAQRAVGRVFRSYGRVFKTRPQKHFFVVYL